MRCVVSAASKQTRSHPLNVLSHYTNQQDQDDANGFSLFVWKERLVAVVTGKERLLQAK
jgi:hypothetical protein